MAFKVTTLVLLLHLSGSRTLEEVTVKCTNICALMETNAQLVCHYDFDVKTAYWFTWKQRTNWKDTNEPEDLTLDMDYSGRVNQTFNKESSTLTISDLRGQDSGEYQLIFIMEDGVKRFASAAVNLTATDLQVSPTDPRGNTVKLACDTSCDLTVQPQKFYWRKNGQYMPEEKFYSRFITVPPAGSYSCSLYYLQSSPVCVSESACWNVAYPSRRVCALEGSTVEISSSYSHPSGFTVTKTFWHLVQPGDFRNLQEEDRFAGRVEYEENKLRIKELKMDDSGQYQFRIITDKEGKFSGSPGVILTVTDLQVTSHPDATADGKVILSCATRCTLSEKHTFIWYKNGRRVTEGFTKANKLYLDSIGSEEFSCAVEETEGPEENDVLQKSMIFISLLLILALIGVLFFSLYQRRQRKKSQHDDVTKNTVLCGSSRVCDNASQPVQMKDEDVHYSCVDFKPHMNEMPLTPVREQSNSYNVEYASVKFR